MKHVFTIFTILLFSQLVQSQGKKNTYDMLWKQVQKYENEALTKSALEMVASISTKAKKENNSPQIIKALLYTSKFTMTLEEDAQLKIINDFKTAISKADFPTKNVLESYLANLYWQYFQQHRYLFYDRTRTDVKVDSTDFRTWDLTTLFQEINIRFEASLTNANGLQQIQVRDFKELLVEQPDSEIFRPTLFDLLAHTALDFFKTSENNIIRPADKFEIDSPEMLSEANQFIQLSIISNEKTSQQSRALSIFQQLLKFHLKDKSLDAFVEVDIERLEFIYQNANFDQKDELFVAVVNNSAESLKPHEISALYTYEVAQLYHQQGNTFQPKANETHRWKQKEALELCETVLLKFPDSRAAAKCKALKAQILTSTLQMVAERFVPINAPSRILVTYKNHSNLKLSAHRISYDGLKKLNALYPEANQLDFINKLTLYKKWETSLKNEQDYQSHGTEILLPPLENGQYVILATPIDGSKTFAFSSVQVTNMALIENRTPDQHNFQVVDRGNGKPIAGAQLVFNYQKNYDGAILKMTKDSDSLGMVSISLTGEHWNNVVVSINYEQESAYFGEFYVNERQNHNEPGINDSCFLFTDRSIYRPGQTLYFKGIAIKNNQGVSSILENVPVSITLNDVNNQAVGTQEFKTNAYGSFAGAFILPANGLTGNYSLTVNSKTVDINGDAYFSVEEYKRPKFETSLEPVTESYRVNDSVTIKGNATAYAGSSITDAKVVYTVRRSVYFPRWYYWHHPYFNNDPQEIVHGETTTDVSGKYKIDFKALADASVPKENLPTFSFEVMADVTDINGETHSTNTVVTVGYHTLTANMYLDNPLDKDSKQNKLTISTNNLNGQFVPVSGTVKMYKLKAPEFVLRPRPWAAPDIEGFGKAKFKELFPHDAFENEHDPANWAKGELVWESRFDTGKSKDITLGNASKWLSGAYLLELETKDKFGQLVKDVIQTTLFSKNDKSPADRQLFGIKVNKDDFSIGDNVEITLLSSADDLEVTLFVEKNRKIIDTHLIHLNKNSKTYSVPVNRNDMGGFAINYSFSIYNSFHTGSLHIAVPYPKTDLEIETLTFRDKLRPGSEETWSFKIKGPKSDKVSAELLASMYDASLDTFRDHNWSFQPLIQPSYYSNSYCNAGQSFGLGYFRVYEGNNTGFGYVEQGYDSLDWFGLYFGNVRSRMLRKVEPAITNAMGGDEMQLEEAVVTGAVAPMANDASFDYATSDKNRDQEDRTENNGDKASALGDVQIRKNLQETAFFFPQLMTDKEGNVTFSFTSPEALTKWKLQLLAHTKTLESAVTSMETVTQKELMVTPNAPRFLREGDEIVISAKIANLTENSLTGKAILELTDAVTDKNATSMLLSFPVREDVTRGDLNNGREFKVDSMGNTQVSWTLKIPKGIQAVQYKVIAKAGDFSDGEQSFLPVMMNRLLVTETMPMWVRGNQSKTFVMDKLKQHTSATLSNHQLTLEITSNPAWYAVQALPYLMEYPYECNEQTFAKYYANTLASHIVNGNPRIKEVFEQWAGTDALQSNLEKNEEIKSLLIQETPWLRDAQSETEQKKRIALLFDMNLMKNQQAMALTKLSNSQMSTGAWPWFNGGRDNRFITQHIITGMGHLKKLGVDKSGMDTPNYNQMIQKAVRYLDSEFVAEYEQMKKYAKNLNDDHLSETQIHYLYMRSFFKEIKASKKVVDITSYYKGQAQKYWMARSLYAKGMLALVQDRMADDNTAHKILHSLEENSISSEELGMYWKENTSSWLWYQAPIETQALLIEAFSEIKNDVATVDNLKIWLLKNKQTNQWKTTKATTDAVYALLLQGSDWLSLSSEVTVLVGGEKMEFDRPTKGNAPNINAEAGTGYHKTSWTGSEIVSQMAEVQISKQGAGIAWGALYWQYFEDLDKITQAETPLKLKKKLFLKKNTDIGEALSELTPKTNLQVGDLVRVRIELRSDREMEFVHMKDMRAAGFEPINVLSAYKWQDGLGYYESTKDASTNFFFDYLPKGVFVFEYDLRVNNAGNFSNGITTIQSMYAPEFSSHSEGVRVSVVGEK